MQTDNSIAAVYELEHKSTIRRPLFLSGVSAGFPSPAEDYVDRKLDLNELLIKNPAATFFVRVAGDSMTGAGIHHDDILIVDRSLEPVSGNIVIAVYNGELTVKRLRQKGGKACLAAENPSYSPLVISEENECEIWGVVTSVVHQF
jgi:DNA polymerase V